PSHNYVTLDDLDYLAQAKGDPKDFIQELGREFIIDEAQRVPILTIAIKNLLDQKKGIHAILTGSTGLHLLDSAGDTLAGRIQIFHLSTCCWGEDAGAALDSQTKSNSLVAQRNLKNVLEFGGFPEVLNFKRNQEKEEVLTQYKNTYFTRDLAELSSIENIEGMKALYQAIIKGICSRYEISSLVKETGMSTPTVKKYMNAFLQSGLMFKLYGYHLGPAKRYISSAKTYFCDNGIISSLSDEFSSGQAFENFVISEIEKRRKIGFYSAEQLYYYESTGGREIDLIIEEKKQILCIEVKSSQNVSDREIRSLREFEIPNRKKLLRKFFVYQGKEHFKSQGIEFIPVAHFFRTGRPVG
ncbi:MAG: ATP-binding protein, partial [Pseudobdellovibrionaceae bacterium]